MKRKQTLRSLIVVATLISAVAFTFVNVQTGDNLDQQLQAINFKQEQVESDNMSESRKLIVPNVTVLGRLWEIAQRYLDKSN